MYLSSFQDFTNNKSTSVQVWSKNKRGGGGGHSPGSATNDEALNLDICSKNVFKSTCSYLSPIEFVMRPSTHSGDEVGFLRDQHQISPCNINAL